MWFNQHKSAAATIMVLFLFAALVAMAVSGDNTGIRGKMQDLTAAVRRPLSDAGKGIKNGFAGIFKVKELTGENQRLTAEKKELEQQNANLKLQQREYEELKALSRVFQYEAMQSEHFLAANVVSVDHSNWMQVFTIDQGARSGVTKDAVVLDGQGLAGRVSQVSQDSAKIVSVLDERSKIGFQMEKDPQVMGVAQGSGKAGVSGYLLDKDAEVRRGDVLVTSGIGHYPKGLRIGKVSAVEKNKGTQSISIQVEPEVMFKSLQKVAVVL